jgi:hypothetical protein
MYPISDPANYVLDMHRHRTARAGRHPGGTEARLPSRKLRRPAILTGIAAAVVAVITPVVTADARPLEGDGVPVELPACTSLQQLVIDADDKAKAIIGLDGPNADEELARIRTAVSATCTD